MQINNFCKGLLRLSAIATAPKVSQPSPEAKLNSLAYLGIAPQFGSVDLPKCLVDCKFQSNKIIFTPNSSKTHE
jgi:hypothetical protein